MCLHDLKVPCLNVEKEKGHRRREDDAPLGHSGLGTRGGVREKARDRYENQANMKSLTKDRGPATPAGDEAY